MNLINSLKAKLPPNIGILLFPILLLFILAILYSFLFRVGYWQILSRWEDIKQGRQNETVLAQKLEVLRRVEGEILDQADLALAALPEENSGLWMLLQLRRLSEEKSMPVTNKKVDQGVEGEDLSRVRLTFKVEGSGLSQIIDFLNSTQSLAPLSSIAEAEIVERVRGGTTNATVVLWTYWAPFPEKLPRITAPIKELSDQERAIMTKLAGLRRPELIEVSPIVAQPTPPSPRVDPFSF